MKPQKLKDLLPKLSKQLQLSEEEIKSVLDIYWDKVRKSLKISNQRKAERKAKEIYQSFDFSNYDKKQQEYNLEKDKKKHERRNQTLEGEG